MSVFDGARMIEIGNEDAVFAARPASLFLDAVGVEVECDRIRCRGRQRMPGAPRSTMIGSVIST